MRRGWRRGRAKAENEAIALLMRLGREFGARIHIVHLSPSDSLPHCCSRAKDGGGPVTVETCPHYLTFAAEEIADGATEFKCAPPIRERENREKLWACAWRRHHRLDRYAIIRHVLPQMKLPRRAIFCARGAALLRCNSACRGVDGGTRARLCCDALAKWLCEGPARLAGLQEERERSRWATTLTCDLGPGREVSS